jgi:hypothetical protein
VAVLFWWELVYLPEKDFFENIRNICIPILWITVATVARYRIPKTYVSAKKYFSGIL